MSALASQFDSVCSLIRASGLVPDNTLQGIIKVIQYKQPVPQTSTFGYSFNISSENKEPVTVGRIQHLPSLRSPNRFQTGKEYQKAEENDRKKDNEWNKNIDTDSQFLLEELKQQGFLNDWQIEQILAGRTKFSLDEYEICDALGQGGYGHLFLAHNPATYNFVAVKVLPLSKSTDELIKRFQKEVALQKKLAHPNLVQFISSGEDGSVSYMVHEFLDGGDVRQLLRQEPVLPFDAVCSIIAQTARALQYLHSQGIVHRDIKPANILMTSTGNVKVIDLGLATTVNSKEDGIGGSEDMFPSPNGSRVAGTIDYLAPEQLRNPNLPLPDWDIYSLGITMYQMLAGTVPFPQGTAKEKFQSKLQIEPKDIRIYNQTVPFDIADLLKSMISIKPETNKISAKTAADRLEKWLPPGGLKSRLLFGGETLSARQQHSLNFEAGF